MIAQRGVAVLLPQPVFHQADEFGALDGAGRVAGQDLRKDFLELVAKVHAGRAGRCACAKVHNARESDEFRQRRQDQPADSYLSGPAPAHAEGFHQYTST